MSPCIQTHSPLFYSLFHIVLYGFGNTVCHVYVSFLPLFYYKYNTHNLALTAHCCRHFAWWCLKIYRVMIHCRAVVIFMQFLKCGELKISFLLFCFLRQKILTQKGHTHSRIFCFTREGWHDFMFIQSFPVLHSIFFSYIGTSTCKKSCEQFIFRYSWQYFV